MGTASGYDSRWLNKIGSQREMAQARDIMGGRFKVMALPSVYFSPMLGGPEISG